MNLKFILPIVVLTAVNGLGGLLPLAAQAKDRDQEKPSENAQATAGTAGQVIPYACYDRSGNVVFTTTNPQETIGWELGCREVQYESSNPASPPLLYTECFDVNGGTAFSTVDRKVARNSDLPCRPIGTRLSLPVVARPVYYECFNTDGTLAFTTSYPQETYGWKPGCREQQYQDTAVAAQQTDTPRTAYECLDTSGNVSFTTYDPQEARRWRIGCRQVRQ